MKIVLVAETFLPEMNGVVNSVLQVLKHLQAGGHEALVIAPRSARDESIDEHVFGAGSALLRSIALPSYPEVRLTFATAGRLEAILKDFQPDVVHLASPFVLGWQALRAADHLGIPTVAIYQTDIPGYAERYGIPAAAPLLSRHLARIHRRATLTLAPSTSARSELMALGVDRLALWARGVDAVKFQPSRRSAAWRTSLGAGTGAGTSASNGSELVIGYVGRLAPEKQVEDLRAIADIPGTRLVIVGDGPSRAVLETMLPKASFLGFRGGQELATIVASFDVFVHPGENETFCQTVQEALASGVPVVATGKGGPLDLVQNSRTGWLYRPGDLDDLRARVLDLLGDDSKRRAFGRAARESVAHRTWSSLGDELLRHYESVTQAVGSTLGDQRPATTAARAQPALQPAGAPPREPWQRFVAVGDSLTEGLSDSSRQSAGEYRGWADRLAGLLAHSGERAEPLLYANLAVRSRRVGDVLQNQIPRAIDLGADLVSVLVGANDLVRLDGHPESLSAQLGDGIAKIRSTGADVLIVTAFAPRYRYLSPLHDRLERFNVGLRECAAQTGSMLLDFSQDPACADARAWGQDRVHLSSHGHRLLSYRAAASLGVPGMGELGPLDIAMHDEPAELGDVSIPTPQWLWTHVRPWMANRVRGRTAGDGRSAKRLALLPVIPADPSESAVPRL